MHNLKIKGTIDLIDQKYFEEKKLIFENITKLPDNLSECKNLTEIIISQSNIDVLNVSKNIQILTLVYSTINEIDISPFLTTFVIVGENYKNINIPTHNNITNITFDSNTFPHFIRGVKI